MARADEAWLRAAAALARQGWGRVEPNPYVGALVVRDGEVVGRGAHRDYGGPHAEVLALRAAGARARGATLYVTLEPCRHHGKTPPCVEAVVAAGVGRVVTAARDPHPEAGGGLEALRARGIRVACHPLPEGAALIAPYVAHLRRRRPFVVAKWAMSLDGRIATRTGDSRYLTGEEARREVHRERARADAVLVGAETVRRDDPELTPRLVRGRTPVRVVLDRRLRMPLRARLVATAERVPTWVLTGPAPPPAKRRRLEARGVQVVPLPRPELKAALRWLRRAGVGRVLVEGGGRLLGAFFAAGAVDRVLCYVAPLLVGDRAAPGPVAGQGPARITRAPRLVGLTIRRRGGDVLLTAEPAATSWGLQAGFVTP